MLALAARSGRATEPLSTQWKAAVEGCSGRLQWKAAVRAWGGRPKSKADSAAFNTQVPFLLKECILSFHLAKINRT